MTTVRLRRMTADDVALGMRLKQQAGWNQTEADWRRLLDLGPDGCFVAELDGAAAGTVATCVFGPVAWVAMVLVDEALRGRGVGTALMHRALEYLEEHCVRTVRLDATPLGRPLYEKLGFVAEYALDRHEGVLPAGPLAGGVETADDLGPVATLDRAATGTERRRFLERLAAGGEPVRVVREGGEVAGFLMSRQGSRALQVGPFIAEPRAASFLFADARRRYAGRLVYMDVPERHSAAGELARGLGLAVRRQLLRMYRGEPVAERPDLLWASSGPEKG